MTKEREALKLALEALKECRYRSLADKIVDPAVTAIKEALAQPDYRAVKTYHEGKPVYVSQPEQEPSVTKTGCGILTLHVGFADLPDGTKFYTTPPKRPWVGLTDEDIAYAYTLEKKFAMQYVDAKLKEKNFD